MQESPSRFVELPRSLWDASVKKVIIDKNQFEEGGLKSWLEQSPSNVAVLTDFSQMESFKGDAIENMKRSLSVLRHHPEQVILLHQTPDNFKIRPRPPHKLFKRFIDYPSTIAFPEIVKKLDRALSGSPAEKANLVSSGVETNGYIANRLSEMSNLSQYFRNLVSALPKHSLKEFRAGQGLDEKLHQFILGGVLNVNALLSGGVVNKGKRQKHTLTFRYAVSIFAFIMWSIENGRIRSSDELLLNDLIDCNYAAYATLCDGLMTADERAREIYLRAEILLGKVFS